MNRNPSPCLSYVRLKAGALVLLVSLFAHPEASAALVGHWQLNETSGTTAADASGNAHTGTLSGGPAWTTGRVGGGLEFDGVDDVVNAGSGASLDNLAALTVAAWIKPDSLGEGSNGRIVVKGTGGSGGWHLILNSTNQISFAVDYATTDLARRSVASSVTLGAWNHVVVTWTGSATATNAKIYINGVETSSYALTTNGVGARGDEASANLYIGNESGGTRTFDGVLDDVRVYDHVLTSTDIQGMYQAGTMAPVGYWSFNETSGTTSGDSSGNSNTGTLQNFPANPWVTGQIAGGLTFDGVDDVVNAGSGASLDDLASLTASAWIKATNMGEGSFGRIVVKGTGTAGGWQLMVANTNRISFGVDHATTDLARTTTDNAIATGSWYHVAVTWTGSATATNSKIYINGIEATYAITVNGVGARASDASASLYIGNDSGGTRTFNGVLDDVRVFPRVLTTTEIQLIMQTPPDITTTSLPSGRTTVNYGNQQLAATGGTTPYTWSLLSGTLPAGLTGPTGGGVISGTPTTAGTANFSVRVTDAASQTDDQALSITINANSVPNITTTSLPGGTVGVTYNQSVNSTGGDGALLWTKIAGNLPVGLTLSNINSQNSTISGTPTTAETANFTLKLEDVDADSDTQALSIVISGVPEVNVQGNASNIADGDMTPTTADHTDFGSVDITSSTLSRTYTIQNTGTGALAVGTVTVSGTHAADFSVTTQPAASVAASGSSTFVVEFNPSTLGLRTAELSFVNDDANENPYNFSIQGTGTGLPEINVQGNATIIADGDSTPDSADHTDFGSVDVSSGTLNRTYTVQNTGTAPLAVGTVSISGTHAADFSVTAQPSSSVAAGGSTTFVVQFNPSATGLRTAALSFTNDDLDENPFNFSIQGTGTATGPLPLAHWKFDEISGTSAADNSGNGHTGTLQNFPASPWVAGQVSGGLTFDGVDDVVNAGSGASLDDMAAFTAAAWIKATNMGEGSFGRIVVKGTGTAGGWQLMVANTNRISFGVDHATTDLARTTTDNAIATGSWYHVAVTWTGSATATNAKIYVNGVEATYAATTNGVGARASDAAASLYIGNESGGTRTFNGVLDDVRVYNSVLTPGEIQALSGSTPIESPISALSPTAWWKLGANGNDSVGSKTATANGSVTWGVVGPTGVNAVNLAGTGDLEIAHHTDFESTYTVSRTIVATSDAQFRSAVAVAGWFNVNAGGLVDNAIIASKDDSESYASAPWGWTLRAMADGRVILRSRTHFRTVELVAPAGTITTGTWYHVWLRWDRRGLTAAINGKQLADGYPTALNWHGWKHRIRTTTYTNSSKIRLGKSGTSGRANIQVAQWAVFMAGSDGARQDIGDAQDLAQVGAVSPLGHHIWNASSANLAPGSGLQAAIDARSAAGGGRVMLTGSGNYTGDITLKNNVEIVGATGVTAVLTGHVSTPDLLPSATTITTPGTALNAGATSWTLGSGHGVTVGDWLWVLSNRILPNRWSSIGNAADPAGIPGAGGPSDSFRECEVLQVATVSGNIVTFRQPVYYSYPTAQIVSVRRLTPHKNISLRNVTLRRAAKPLQTYHLDGFRLVDVNLDQTSTALSIECFEVRACFGVDSPQGLQVDNASTNPVPPQTGNNPYGMAVRYTTRDVAIIGADLFAAQWHAIAHSSSSGYDAGVMFCDYVDSLYSTTTSTRPIDIHGVAAEIRFIGGEITTGGGVSLCGFRNSLEDLKVSGSVTASGFDVNDGALGSYIRNFALPNPTKWFDTANNNRGVGDCHIQDTSYTGTPVELNTCVTHSSRPNTQINAISQLPN